MEPNEEHLGFARDMDLDLDNPALFNKSEIPSSYDSDLSLLDRALIGKTDVFVSKVINIMLKTQVDPDDPVFLLLLAVAELELILVNTPLNIEDVLSEFKDEVSELFVSYFGEQEYTERIKATVAEEKLVIAQAVEDLIKTTEKQKFYGSLNAMCRSIAPTAGILILAMAFGSFLTFQYHNLVLKSMLGNGKMTPEQYESFTWAQSEEGRLGRKIMELNKGYVGKPCREDMKQLGIKLTSGGRKAETGFCLLYIDPPDKRKYSDS